MKWIDCVEIADTGRTKVWRVQTKGDAVPLGLIKWWPAWRKYAFFPYEGTLYEQDCLKDIIVFITNRMDERKRKTLVSA